MLLKPDYEYKSIYDIELDKIKQNGIKALLFDLDSTIMASKTGFYTEQTIEWIDKVKKDFFVGVISNNNNPVYMQQVLSCSNFPIVFDAHKPDTKVAQKFMETYGLKPETTCFVGDRPLTDIACGKHLGCKTILVDSITADSESAIVRFARWLERCSIAPKN